MSTWPVLLQRLFYTLGSLERQQHPSTFFPGVLNTNLEVKLPGKHPPQSFVLQAEFYSGLSPLRGRCSHSSWSRRPRAIVGFRMARAGRGSHPFLSRLPHGGQARGGGAQTKARAVGPRAARGASSSPEATLPAGGEEAPAPRGPLRSASAWAAGLPSRGGRGAPRNLPAGARGPRHPTAWPAGPHCPRRRVPPHTPPARVRPGPAGRGGRQTFSSSARRSRPPRRVRQAGRSSPGRAAGPLPQPHPGPPTWSGSDS